MSLKTLTSARTAIEPSRGSVTTCTRLLYAADMSWNQTIGTITPAELRNTYYPGFRSYPGLENAAFTFSGDVVYDDMAFWMSMAVKGGVTGTGAADGKTWAFTPTAASDDLKSFTLEASWVDNLAVYGNRWPGVMVDEFGLKWEKDKAVAWNAKCTTFKPAVAITAYTGGALSDRTSVTALGTTAVVTIDAAGGTIGTTPDSSVVSAEFTLKNQLVELNTLDGTAVGQALYRPKPRDVQLKLTRYLSSIAELTAYIGKTERKIRVKTTGPAINAGFYSLALDFYGIPTDHKWADVNGLIVEEVTYDPIYDSGPGTDFLFSLVNSIASIT